MSARARGEHPATIALWLDVAVSSVYNICSLQNKLGSIEPKPFTGRRTILTPEQLSAIQKTIELQNDITLDELITKLDIANSYGIIFKKKTLHAKEQQRPDVQEKQTVSYFLMKVASTAA